MNLQVNPTYSRRWQSIIAVSTLCCLGFCLRLDAAVQAVQIRLTANTGSTIPIIYEVPAGKVLVVEHVIFPQYWDDHAQPKSITIRHGGASTAGTIWDTQVTYSANFNTLFRPLKLPAGTAIAAPYLGNSSYLLFLYGLLVDEADLYASVPASLKQLQHHNNGGTEVIEGTLELSSARPAAIRSRQSDDLKTWQDAPDVTIGRGATTRQRDFSYDVPIGKDRYFMELSAHALLRDDYPYIARGFLIAANGTVSTPFLDLQKSVATFGESGVSVEMIPRSPATANPSETTAD